MFELIATLPAGLQTLMRGILELRKHRLAVNLGRMNGFHLIWPHAAKALESEAAVEVSHTLHMLRGELDRAPNSPLVADIWAYLDANVEAEQWRAVAGMVPESRNRGTRRA